MRVAPAIGCGTTSGERESAVVGIENHESVFCHAQLVELGDDVAERFIHTFNHGGVGALILIIAVFLSIGQMKDACFFFRSSFDGE